MKKYTAEEAIVNLISPKGETILNNWEKLDGREYIHRSCSSCGECYLAVDMESPVCIGKSEHANKTSAGDDICDFCKDWLKYQVTGSV